MFRLLTANPNQRNVLGPLPGITLAQRGVKRTKITRKPKLTPVKFNVNGSVKTETTIRGYGPDEVQRYNAWLKKTTAAVAQSVFILFYLIL